VAFFPQLIAGPIDRATKLLSQFHERHDFDYHRVTDGLKLMLWGFFQKVVIADTLATLVDPIYNDPVHYQGIHFAIATVFFAFQIYCDFSGYSDIAIGAAQVFGYTSINNFERPYFSKSIPEFWRRWHISLSTWFRDYLYVPLGGNRVSLSRLYFNILIVFLVSGLWHGSNWTFVVWGGVHGFYYIMSVITQSARTKLIRIIGLHKTPIVHKYLKAAITFFLVSFAWIFFRANSISDALFIVSHIFTGWEQGFGALSPFTQSKFEFIIGVASTLFMVFGHLLQRRGSVREMLSQKPLVVRWALYYGIILLILLLGNFGSKQFIYFQF
jgi:D-alanyl-lipoteichoic acid acyltransferase DltB (MBOAT superfamily)